MSYTTEFLQLLIPGFNEFRNRWHEPMLENFKAIDSWAAQTESELISARFQGSTLAEFLSVSLNPDGTAKPAAEVETARNSLSYGTFIGVGKRIDAVDTEVRDARVGAPSLKDAVVRLGSNFGSKPNSPWRGVATNDGFASFLSNSAAAFQVSTASGTIPLEVNIQGGFYRFRNDTFTEPVTGSPGKRYLYAASPTEPKVLFSRIDLPTGSLTTNEANFDALQILEDTNFDFTTLGLMPGDQLQIMNSAAAGVYTIDAIAQRRLTIKGVFPERAANLTYRILDPLEPELIVDTVAPGRVSEIITTNRCPLGEATFDGTVLVDVISYAFNRSFESTWQAVNTSTQSGLFIRDIDHNLGFRPDNITILASTTDSDSGDIEVLSTSGGTSSLTVSGGHSFIHSDPTISPVPAGSVWSPGSFSGGVTVSLGGSYDLDHSVTFKMNKLSCSIKNPTPNVVYRDFAGVIQTSAYIKVILEA